MVSYMVDETHPGTAVASVPALVNYPPGEDTCIYIPLPAEIDLTYYARNCWCCAQRWLHFCLVPGPTVNRLPGLQSSKQNLEKENEVYDGMMLDVIRLLVLPPLTGCPPEPGLFEVSAYGTIDAPRLVDGKPCILSFSRL